MTELTVSQALRRIKKLKGLLVEHLTNAQMGLVYPKGEDPAFFFEACWDQANKVREELIDLEVRLAITNSVTVLLFDGEKTSLVGAIRSLQELKSQISWLRALPVRSQLETIDSEVEYLAGQHQTVKKVMRCELPEGKRTECVRKLQDQFDRLNDAVETANHKTGLVPL